MKTPRIKRCGGGEVLRSESPDHAAVARAPPLEQGGGADGHGVRGLPRRLRRDGLRSLRFHRLGGVLRLGLVEDEGAQLVRDRWLVRIEGNGDAVDQDALVHS